MSKTWLLIDVSYLCHRAFYKLGSLETDGVLTGAVYGLLREFGSLQDRFDSRSPVWCFDMGYDVRLELQPGYKRGRRERYLNQTPEERQAKAELERQLKLLRTKYLPTIGFRNILCQQGYEADDMIAAACKALPEGDDAVIVSADSDLWQLLSPNIITYSPANGKSPAKVMTDRRLQDEFGVVPAQWASVKALAGCGSDSIDGLKGIGEVYAARWFAGKLKPESAAYAKIAGEGVAVHNANIKLTRLPFPGTQPVTLYEDRVTRERWQFVCDKLKFPSLREMGVV